MPIAGFKKREQKRRRIIKLEDQKEALDYIRRDLIMKTDTHNLYSFNFIIFINGWSWTEKSFVSSKTEVEEVKEIVREWVRNDIERVLEQWYRGWKVGDKKLFNLLVRRKINKNKNIKIKNNIKGNNNTIIDNINITIDDDIERRK